MMFPWAVDPNWVGWLGFGSLLFWIGLVVLTALVLIAGARPESDKRSAQDILDERFARGEIDPDDYRSRRALIDG